MRGSAAKVKQVMGEFKRGTLRSGSKRGPKVKSRAQAVAIAMKQSGQSRDDAGPRRNRLAFRTKRGKRIG
jgi:hypothetical protein